MGKFVDGLKKAAKRIGNAFKHNAVEIQRDSLFDYSTPESRAKTALFCLSHAESHRQEQVRLWQLYQDYYDGKHDAIEELRDFCAEHGIPFTPAMVTDPFVHCESQIVPEIPEHEFAGRDDDQDGAMAKQRQYVVQYIIDNNDMETKNANNERRINIKGDAWWKVGYDVNLTNGRYMGDIFILDIDPLDVLTDPTALILDNCEYLSYPYTMHRLKALREFGKDMQERGLSMDNLTGVTESVTTTLNSQSTEVTQDIVQIVEHWFRQPFAGSEEYTYEVDGQTVTDRVEWEAGDIACTILIGNHEVKYIPKYWRNTGKQNKQYPFIKANKVPILNSFWGMSEIAPIKELVDAADREFATVILNDAMTGNDILVVDQSALADGTTEVSNAPGSTVYVKDGRLNAVARVGNLSGMNRGLKETVFNIQDMIKQTVGNFDINMGAAPPSNVATLGGLIELKEQGNSRQNRKLINRTAAFKRLYKLIDFTALEFWDEDRVIYLGALGDETQAQPPSQQQPAPQPGMPPMDVAPDGMEQPPMGGMEPPPPMPASPPNMDRSNGPVQFNFNSMNMRKARTNGRGELEQYYPDVDIRISVGDGIKNSKALTLQATENIAKMPMNVQNYKIILSMLDILQLPNRKEIKSYIEDFFAQQAQAAQQPQQTPPKEPAVSINFRDMPPDAKQQLLAKMGIKIDKQEIELNDLLLKLTSQERDHLRQNPHLYDETSGEQLPPEGGGQPGKTDQFGGMMQ